MSHQHLRSFLLGCISLAFVLLFTPSAHAATYYAATSGGSSCSAAQNSGSPIQGINAGIGCLSGGDTLIVKSGTYNEVILDTIPSGSQGNPTIVKSEVQYGAILQPDASQPAPDGVGFVIFGLQEPRSYITLDGFVLDAVNAGERYIVYMKWNSDHITISNNEIKNCANRDSGTSCDGIVPGGGYHLIRGNKIHDIGFGSQPGQQFYSYGMYLPSVNNIVENNEIYNCSGYGIHGYNSMSAADNNIIRNNSIHDNNGQGLLIASGGNGDQIYNNLIYNNGLRPGGNTGDGGIIIVAAGTTANDTSIHHNTIYGNRGACIGTGSGTANNTKVQNNICFHNGNDTPNAGNNSTIDHNFTSDPQFVNPPNDFHLQPSSPAKTAASDGGEVGAYANGGSPGIGGGGTPPSGGSTQPTGTPCSTLDASSALPSGFGSPMNFFTNPVSRTVESYCSNGTVTVNVSKPSSIQYHYTYSTAYQWNATLSQWQPFELNCYQLPLIANAWCAARADKIITPTSPYFIVYTCSWVNGQWMCGCRDAQCSQGFWQVQKFQL